MYRSVIHLLSNFQNFAKSCQTCDSNQFPRRKKGACHCVPADWIAGETAGNRPGRQKPSLFVLTRDGGWLWGTSFQFRFKNMDRTKVRYLLGVVSKLLFQITFSKHQHSSYWVMALLIMLATVYEILVTSTQSGSCNFGPWIYFLVVFVTFTWTLYLKVMLKQKWNKGLKVFMPEEDLNLDLCDTSWAIKPTRSWSLYYERKW